MPSVETFLEKHLAWIASIIIGVGFYLAVLQGQSQAITQLQLDVHKAEANITQLERCIVKLDTIDKSLEEMKCDIKEIKKVLYKPVVAYNEPK